MYLLAEFRPTHSSTKSFLRYTLVYKTCSYLFDDIDVTECHGNRRFSNNAAETEIKYKYEFTKLFPGRTGNTYFAPKSIQFRYSNAYIFARTGLHKMIFRSGVQLKMFFDIKN